jgi:hypothetical protein
MRGCAAQFQRCIAGAAIAMATGACRVSNNDEQMTTCMVDSPYESAWHIAIFSLQHYTALPGIYTEYTAFVYDFVVYFTKRLSNGKPELCILPGLRKSAWSSDKDDVQDGDASLACIASPRGTD